MKITIVDDEINSIRLTKNYLNQYDSAVEVIGEYTNPMKAVEEFQANKPDVLLLDIEMPEMSGFDLLEKVDTTNVNVVFLTAYDQYAIRAIKCSAIDYILKPYSFDELKEALDKSRKSLKNDHYRMDSIKQEEQQFIVLRGLQEYHKIDLAEIVYAEGQRGGYTEFNLVNGTRLLASKPLAYYQDVLDSRFFEKIHKSHIVNIDQVDFVDLDTLSVSMRNGVKLDIAIRRKAGFIKRLKSI
ncbi:MAG: response regulator transcription factor [Bacteroidia bacterium]|nr:response regulator transcription factor [Bacteroidia bacterium]